MSRYEILTIFTPSLTDEQKELAVAKYTKLIEDNGAKLVGLNKWGLKKFAYPIDYKKEGYYVLFEIDADEGLPNKIANLMRIDDNVMRNLCLKKTTSKFDKTKTE